MYDARVSGIVLSLLLSACQVHPDPAVQPWRREGDSGASSSDGGGGSGDGGGDSGWGDGGGGWGDGDNYAH